MKEKGEKSKLMNLHYDQLKIQNYLKPNEICQRKQKLLFKLRTRMIHVASNYGQVTPCPLCNNFASLDSQLVTQEHLYNCEKLNEVTDKNVIYSNIFSNNIEKLAETVNKADTLIRKRETLKLQRT